MMTRKHFNPIAKILRESFAGRISNSEAVAELCDLFQNDNPAFDAKRFQEAVDVQAGEL